MGRWAVVCVSSMRTQGEGEGFFRARASGERTCPDRLACAAKSDATSWSLAISSARRILAVLGSPSSRYMALSNSSRSS